MIPTKYSTPLLGLDWLERYEPHNVYHPGIDLGLAGTSDIGNNVVAAKSGFVEYIYDGLLINSGGFGRQVIIQHADGTCSQYAHLKDITVKANKEVKENEIIGHLGGSGTTETSYSPHLHFSVMAEMMATIQRSNWRPWRYYPTGKDKIYVQQYYINPWDWLKTEDVSKWEAEAVKYWKDKDILKTTENLDSKQIWMLEILRKYDILHNKQ